MRRAGRRTVEQARKARRAYLRRNGPVLAVYVVGGVVVVMLSLIPQWSRRPALAAYLAGASTVGVVWSAWKLVVDGDGQQHRFAGAGAEKSTASELAQLRSHGWVRVDDIDFADFNVDHVLVGPGGVFAIETKWISVPWRLEQGRLVTGLRRSPARQAVDGARKIALLLRSHAELDVEVTPVLAVWGPGRPDLPGGSAVAEGAVVLRGRGCASYFRSLPAARLDRSDIDAAHHALLSYVEGRDAYEARRAALR